MTKKFTEEQYQKIVEIGDEYHDGRLKKTEVLLDYMYDDFGFNGGEDTEPLDQALALANPITREWAHDKFVEKEKRYIWKLNGLYLVKSTGDGSIFFGSHDASMALSTSQVMEWGFNPKMFNKEEV